MSLQLPEEPDQYFISEILLPDWTPSDVHGFNANAPPGSSNWVAYGTKLDNVGEYYPSLIISASNEVSGGESGYQYMTPDGPGQNRNGSLVATARVQDTDGGYTADATVDADTLAGELIDHVEDICQWNAAGGGTEFQSISSQPGPDAPDDTEERPYVRMATCTIDYSWLRTPTG